jgi:hypothetical protein
MTDLAVDRLRIRGPGARRLAEVATRVLPGALERALSDLDDVHLDTLTVRLDLDPSDYDDQTLAALWADAIRTQVLAAGGRTTPGAGTRPPSMEPDPAQESYPAPASDPWSLADVAEAATAWMARSPQEDDVLPRALLLLARAEVATAVAAHLDEPEWRLLVARLRTALQGQERVPPDELRSDVSDTGERRSGPPTARSPVAPTEDRPAPEVPDEPAVASVTGPDATTPAGDVEVAQVLHRLDTLAELVADGSGPVDLASVTHAAGLVLLWPWLADVCRAAETLHPGLTPHRVRAHALAWLADPDDPALVDDPLVRLLIGAPADEDADLPGFDRPLPGLDEVTERTLAAFAGLLPGFSSSSSRFVRYEWVVRLGVLDATTDPAGLVAATHPLDVLLPKLPYPVTLFKLPWSPLVSVRFRP